MRLSIIVPAYKVEEFIEKCIRSLQEQDVAQTEYEIIVTNDGSPDQSRQIVENLQKEFSNLRLINQENQGVSIARNEAIATAKGKYIMPIDPDDFAEQNMLSQLLHQAESTDLDILVAGFEIFDPQGKSIWQTNYSQLAGKVITGVTGYFASRGKDVRDPDRSWAILYKRKMIQDYAIDYPKGVPFLEDGCFLVKVFSVAQNVGFADSIFYKRTTTEGSATVSGVFYTEKAINGFIAAAVNLRTFSTKNKLSQNQQGLINHGIVKYVLLSLFQNVNLKSIGRFSHIVAKLKAHGIVKLPIQGVVEPYDKYAKYFNVSPYLFFLLYSKENIIAKYLK